MSEWFVESGFSTCKTNPSALYKHSDLQMCKMPNNDSLENNSVGATGHYLSFFCDRLSSMNLYFWCCSCSLVITASAFSLPGCFIKDSTSSWKTQKRCERIPDTTRCPNFSLGGSIKTFSSVVSENSSGICCYPSNDTIHLSFSR